MNTNFAMCIYFFAFYKFFIKVKLVINVILGTNEIDRIRQLASYVRSDDQDFQFQSAMIHVLLLPVGI